MRKNQIVKEQRVSELVQKMRSSSSFASISYSSLSCKSSEWLRKELKKKQGEIQMVSNNVLSRAISEFSNSTQALSLSGQHLVLFLKSEKISSLKIMAELVKKYELLKFGIVYCNNQFLSEEQKEYISLWLEREEVFSKLAYLLNYPILSLTFTIKAISNKAG